MSPCGKGLNSVMIGFSILLPFLFIFSSVFAWSSHSSGRELNNISISAALAEDNFGALLSRIIFVICGIIIFFHALARDIQIRVIFQRYGNYKPCIVILNTMSAIILIIGSSGFIVMALIPVSDTDLVADAIHGIAATIAFAMTLLYQIFHTILTNIQRNMEKRGGKFKTNIFIRRYIEIIYFIPLVLIALILSIIFGITQAIQEFSNPDLHLDYAMEWGAFWILNLYWFMYGWMLYIDPIDDELKDFFCCTVNKNSETKLNTTISDSEMGVTAV